LRQQERQHLVQQQHVQQHLAQQQQQQLQAQLGDMYPQGSQYPDAFADMHQQVRSQSIPVICATCTSTEAHIQTSCRRDVCSVTRCHARCVVDSTTAGIRYVLHAIDLDAPTVAFVTRCASLPCFSCQLTVGS
jgi:hypothetical protein